MTRGGTTAAKREHERRKIERAAEKAADRAERRAAKRLRGERFEHNASARAERLAAAMERPAEPERVTESPAIPPTPVCALCGRSAPSGTWLADPHRWPGAPRWVHRLCVLRRRQAQP